VKTIMAVGNPPPKGFILLKIDKNVPIVLLQIITKGKRGKEDLSQKRIRHFYFPLLPIYYVLVT
jgi:hypothetical protein